MSNFVLRGYTRRIARSVVDAMVPRWPEFDVDMTEDVLSQVEDTIRGYPIGIQLGVLAMLYGVEFGGPVTLSGVRPFSWLSREEAEERLAKVADHKIPQVRLMPMLLKLMVGFAAYSRPDVEEFLGAPRRAWRRDRQAFREDLVRIDDLEPSPSPSVPSPLGGDPLATPETYLEFTERRESAAPEVSARIGSGS